MPVCASEITFACVAAMLEVRGERVQVATLIHADWLFLLTDVAGLYSGNPTTDPSATAIHQVDAMSALKVTYD